MTSPTPEMLAKAREIAAAPYEARARKRGVADGYDPMASLIRKGQMDHHDNVVCALEGMRHATPDNLVQQLVEVAVEALDAAPVGIRGGGQPVKRLALLTQTGVQTESERVGRFSIGLDDIEKLRAFLPAPPSTDGEVG